MDSLGESNNNTGDNMTKQCAEIQVNTNSSFIIINGQQQESKIITLNCPQCNNILFNLGQAINTLSQAYDFLTVNKNEIQKRIPYCCKCGTELFYPELVEIVEENA